MEVDVVCCIQVFCQQLQLASQLCTHMKVINEIYYNFLRDHLKAKKENCRGTEMSFS